MIINHRLKDILIVIFLIGTVVSASHFVITNPLGPSRLLYYLQVPFIQLNTRCSDSAPSWMPKFQHFAISKIATSASQLVFISPDGVKSNCETGWKDGFWGDELLKPDDRFRYASTTKTITAIAIIDLVNAGSLSLNDRIVQVLGLTDELKDHRVADISIEHLLSHRAGWDRVRTQDVMFTMNRQPWCPSEPRMLSGTSLLYVPGERESYSNLGYCLLGLAIERASGKAFRDYIIDAFGESSSIRFIDGPYQSGEVNYDLRNEDFYMANYHNDFDFSALSSSAGLSGNASDLAVLVRDSLLRGPLTVLSGDMGGDCNPAEIQQCYGYGVFRFQPEQRSAPIYMHGGKLPGVTSLIAISADGGVLVWLGAGLPRPASDGLKDLYKRVHSVLTGY